MKTTVRIFIIAICFSCVSCLAEIDSKNCDAFANTCRDNKNDVHVASLNVGTGECHVVRKGDQSIVIDAGLRFGSKAVNGAEENIENSLKKLLSNGEGKLDEDKNLIESSLQAIFITHPHEDHHKKLLRFLMNMHKKTKDNPKSKIEYKVKLFLGGIGSKYEDRYGNAYGRQLQNCGSSRIIIDNTTITYRDLMKDGSHWDKESDTNGHGAVFFVEYRNRTFAFLGDANKHSLHLIAPNDDVNRYFGMKYTSSSHLSVHAKDMWEKLIAADILTVPHHASFENGENELYSEYCLKQKSKKRIFIASASPENQGDNIPRIKKSILDESNIGGGFGEIFEHKLSYCDDKQIQNKNTKAPIFSTYDAPGGFVWTKIDSNGNMFINNGFDDKENNKPIFRQVLQDQDMAQ